MQPCRLRDPDVIGRIVMYSECRTHCAKRRARGRRQAATGGWVIPEITSPGHYSLDIRPDLDTSVETLSLTQSLPSRSLEAAKT